MAGPVWLRRMRGDTRAWAAAALLVLAACGGGGSGGEEPPPAPSPASGLVIQASSTEVSAGGAPVDLTAVLPSGSATVRWSLAGPGRLSATQGPSVRYTPPPSGDQRVSAPARVTASSSTLIQTLTLRVNPAPGSPAPAPGTRWEVASLPKTYTTDLSWLDERFFAVTRIGDIVNSTDGITWSPASTPGGHLLAIAKGVDSFLAVGRNTVLKSADGDTWVNAGASGSFEYWELAAGNGVFVANGQGGLARSVDGAVWTPIGPPMGRGYAVAFGSGCFVAVGNTPYVHTSVDGVNWTSTGLSETPLDSAAVAYGNGRFVLVTTASHYTSENGIDWARQPARNVTGYKLRFANGVFHLMGTDRIWSSSDGVQWREVYSLTTAITRFAGMAEGAGRTVIADDIGPIRHRAVVGELIDAWPGPSRHVTGMTALGSALYAVTDYGDVLHSSDARLWETVASLPASFRGITYGNGRFVAVSEGGGKAIYTSLDGRNWSAANAGDLFTRKSAVAYGDGVFVASGLSGEVLRSSDGDSWVSAPTPARVELTGVAHGAGRFVAISIQGQVVSSTDGLNWTLVREGLGRMLGITHGPQGFVAVGGWGTDPGFIWTSPDGLSWTQRSDTSSPSLIAVAHGNGHYIATGHNGAVVLSTDGVQWQRRSLGIHPNLLAVAAPPGRFVAAGMGGAIVLSEQ